MPDDIKTTSRSLPVYGIVPPLVTPLLPSGKLDRSGLERIANRAIDAGVKGLFVLGTTGEAPSLTAEIKRDLIVAATEIAAGRVPVLVGLIETSCDDALRLAAFAADHGAAGLVLAPPFYFPLSQPELLAYVERICVKLPLPTFYYNIPSMTKVDIEPDTMRALSELPNICGLKDSSANIGNFASIRRLLPDVTLFWGPEEKLVEAMAAGANGGITGGANLFPELYVALYDAISRGEAGRAENLQALVRLIGEQIYAGEYGSTYLPGLKCAIEESGLASGKLAEPLAPVGERQRLAIRARLPELRRKVADLTGA